VRPGLWFLALFACIALIGTANAGLTASTEAKAKKKVTICHRTASNTNPYVLIRVSKSALKGHRRHAGDIIPAPKQGCPSQPMSPTQGGTALTAALTGGAEVPGPGDPDGTGTATIRLTAGEGRLCFNLAAMNITLPAAAAHIHLGAAGTAGGVVVGLQPPNASGTASGCVTVQRTLVNSILANPAAYYVNVHTADYPDGAIRGQLAA
jgi:hypothetical protein